MSVLLIMVITTVIVVALGFSFVLGVLLDKGKQIFNPMKKDNSDYRFIQVKNEKTRNIFS